MGTNFFLSPSLLHVLMLLAFFSSSFFRVSNSIRFLFIWHVLSTSNPLWCSPLDASVRGRSSLTRGTTCVRVVLRLRAPCAGESDRLLTQQEFSDEKDLQTWLRHPRQGCCSLPSPVASLRRSAACGSVRSYHPPGCSPVYVCAVNAASHLLQYEALVSCTIPSFCLSLVLCPICQDDFELHSHPRRHLQPLRVTSRLNKHTFSSTAAIDKNTGKHETKDRLILAVNFQ